jgi:uncharacterized membrane protein YsdA (DUF1294 family)
MEKTIILLYYVVMNTFSFGLCAADKTKAVKGSFRIPEKVLLLTGLLGGALGLYLAMLTTRHKTKKAKFRILVPLLILLHAYLLLKIFSLL